MIGERWVLLVWSCASLVPWLAVWAARPRLRGAMAWSSLFALPFGFSELMFAGRYWSPPSLFDAAARVHLDVESFVFLFAAGGLASIGYEIVSGRMPSARAPRGSLASRPLRNLAFATPGLVFAAGLVVLHAPIEAGIAAMIAGAVARALARPDLARKVALGGLVFAAYYALLVGSLVWLEPGWVARVWSPAGWPGVRVHGFPIVELAFGASFGAYWSGLWEQYRWTFEPRRRDNGLPCPSSARAACRRRTDRRRSFRTSR